MKRTETRGVKLLFVKTSRDVGMVPWSGNCQVGVKV